MHNKDFKDSSAPLNRSFFSKLKGIPFGTLIRGGSVIASGGGDPRLWKLPFNMLKAPVVIIFGITVSLYTIILKLFGFKDYAEPVAKLLAYIVIGGLMFAAISTLPLIMKDLI